MTAVPLKHDNRVSRWLAGQQFARRLIDSHEWVGNHFEGTDLLGAAFVGIIGLLDSLLGLAGIIDHWLPGPDVVPPSWFSSGSRQLHPDPQVALLIGLCFLLVAAVMLVPRRPKLGIFNGYWPLLQFWTAVLVWVLTGFITASGIGGGLSAGVFPINSLSILGMAVVGLYYSPSRFGRRGR